MHVLGAMRWMRIQARRGQDLDAEAGVTVTYCLQRSLERLGAGGPSPGEAGQRRSFFESVIRGES